MAEYQKPWQPVLTVRFERPHRLALYGTFVFLLGSGIAWLVLHYYFQAEGPFGPSPGPWEPLALKLHGLAGMLSLVCLGSAIPVHMRKAWRRQGNRIAGLALLTLMVWLTLTGYALYYLVAEFEDFPLALAHWASGLALPLVLVFHIYHGRRKLRHKALNKRRQRREVECHGVLPDM